MKLCFTQSRRALVRGVFTLAITLVGSAAAAPVSSNEVEAALIRTFAALDAGRMSVALKEIDIVLKKYPNFRLGHLIRGDILMAQAGKPTALAPVGANAEELADLRQEARLRLKHLLNPRPANTLPAAIVRLSSNHQHAFILDSEKSRLYVFKNVAGKPEYVTDYYVTVGKLGDFKQREGDQRTPVGVYFVTNEITKKLPDLYGSGAFALNFPNELDRRAGRTGSGIWLHGTPSNTYSRPPRASDGCVVLSNDDLASIRQYVNPGSTPVVLAASLAWKTPEQWRKTSADVLAAVESWRYDWEKRNVDSFITHYSTKFDTQGLALATWKAEKRASLVAPSGTQPLKVTLANLSVFAYPTAANSPPMMMVSFEQTFKTSRNNVKLKKSQYWQFENGSWQITHEAIAS